MLKAPTSSSFPADSVLFLHGFMGSASDWDSIKIGLGGTYFSLAVDLPGHGSATGLAEGAYTMESAAHALIEVLDRRGVKQCAIVGYSMGGRLALYVALHFPERCRLLVLESASPGLATAQQRRARREVDEDRAARLEREDLDIFLKEWYRQPLFSSLARHEGLVEALIARRRTNDPQELARSLRGMGTGSQPSLWERLATLRVSTVALAGALDPKYVKIAEQMAELNGQIRVHVVPDAGHNVHLEQPHRYITLLHTSLNQT